MDLVILDLGLPDMDGIFVVDVIRDFSESLPIIIVSARSDEAEKIKPWMPASTITCKSPSLLLS